MRCLNCGTENSERNLNCSNCGADLLNQKKKNIFKNKTFLITSGCILALLIIIFAVVIDSVVTPNRAAEKIKQALEAKSASEVVSVFTEYCGTSSVQYSSLSMAGKAVYHEVEDFVSAAKEDLNNQPIGTDIDSYLSDYAGNLVLPQESSALNTIASYSDELNTIVTDYYNLYSSKISYKKGIQLYKNNDYTNAFYSFSKVIENDSWHENAKSKATECQSKLLEEKITLIEKYISESNYEAAQQEINALKKQPLNDEMTKKINGCETKIYESKLSKIDEYVDSGDMDAVNEYIESLGEGLSADAQARLDQAIKNKASSYISKADAALKSGERQGAYDMALMAQNLCPDNDEITKKVEYFKEYLPFELYKEENYLSQKQGEGDWSNLIYYNKKCTSNDSKTMRHCVYVAYDSVDVSSSSLLRTVTYNLGKKYDAVSGTEFILYYSRSREQKGYFEIYGDGKKIFTSDILGINFLPKDFSISVKNIDTLTVKYYGDTNYRSDTVSYGISNFVATKKLP